MIVYHNCLETLKNSILWEMFITCNYIHSNFNLTNDFAQRREQIFFPLWAKCPILIFASLQVICLPDCKHLQRQLFHHSCDKSWHLLPDLYFWPIMEFFWRDIEYCPGDKGIEDVLKLKSSSRWDGWKGNKFLMYGCHILGEIIKTSFTTFLLPVEGDFTCSRGEGEFIPICQSLLSSSYLNGPPAVLNYCYTLFWGCKKCKTCNIATGKVIFNCFIRLFGNQSLFHVHI